MATFFVTILLTVVIATLLFVLFRWIKMPVYRMTRERLIHVLEMVITGQATENDWQVLMAVTIRHDEVLEQVRERCLAIEEHYYIGDRRPPYLFTEEGLVELKQLLIQLRDYRSE